MVIPCFPNKKEPASTTTTRQQHRNSYLDDELHAFDLTWRNYLPSASQFCCCFKKTGNIRLDDEDPLIEPPYYNDHTLYRGEALQNYLDNPRDWEFESVLGQNDLPQFVTRNPFGTASIKKKKSHKKKKNKRERPVVMETDMEEGDIAGYDIEDNHDQHAYYNDDAEFLGDDQIANLAYNRHSSQVMDQYGEELYYEHVQGPIVQEMQTPPREFYAARTMPDMNFQHHEEEEENYDDYEERVVVVADPSSTSHVTTKPQASVEAAQALLSERLDDLTEKLAFIKNNIIRIRPPAKEQNSDDEFDRNTLHTIKKHNEEEEEEEQRENGAVIVEQNSVSSDIDSITSEALDVYENTTAAYTAQQHTKRYSSSDELHLPSLVDNTPFVSDQHPFTYFTDHSTLPSNQDGEQQEESHENNNNNGLNVRNVLDIGRKWLGI